MWNIVSSPIWNFWKCFVKEHLSPKVGWLLKEQRPLAPILTALHNFVTNIIRGFARRQKTYLVISYFLVLSWTSNREKLVMLSWLCQVFWQTTFLPLFLLFPLFPSFPFSPSFPSSPPFFLIPFLTPFLTFPPSPIPFPFAFSASCYFYSLPKSVVKLLLILCTDIRALSAV